MPTKSINFEDSLAPLGVSLLSQLELAHSLDDPAIMADFLNWQKTRFASQGYDQAEIESMFEQLSQSIGNGMSAEKSAAISELFNQAIIHSKQVEEKKLPAQPQHLRSLADQYIKLLIGHRQKDAADLIMGNVRNGMDIRDIYLHVFQWSLYEIGRLWQTNQLNIAQEHYFTAATQMIMSQLFPFIFSTKRNGKRMIAASVSENMHDIGIRMVADFFEMDGWDSIYLGSNNPPDAILQAVIDNQPYLLALSVTIATHVKNAQNVISLIRNQPEIRHTKIILGGYPFNISAGLWKKIGGDGHARNAAEAIELGNRLTAG